MLCIIPCKTLDVKHCAVSLPGILIIIINSKQCCLLFIIINMVANIITLLFIIVKMVANIITMTFSWEGDLNRNQKQDLFCVLINFLY